MTSCRLNRVFFFAVAVLAATSAYAITIDTVAVGNPGNAGELSGSGAGGYGPDAIVGCLGLLAGFALTTLLRRGRRHV